MNTTERSLINLACMIEEIYILKLNKHSTIVPEDFNTYQCKSLLSINEIVLTSFQEIEKLTPTTQNSLDYIYKDINKLRKLCYIAKTYDLSISLFTNLKSKGLIIHLNNLYSKSSNFTLEVFKEQIYTLLYANLYKDVREKAHQIIMQLNRMSMKYNELHIEEDKPVKQPIVSNLSFESELHKLGYNVVRLNEEQRRDLLVHTAIPKLGKKVVISRLEFFIKLGKNNPKFETGIALERWERDLKFVKSL